MLLELPFSVTLAPAPMLLWLPVPFTVSGRLTSCNCSPPSGGGMVGGLRKDCLAAAGAASLYGGQRGEPAAMTEPIAASSQAPHSSGALVSVRTRAGLVEEGLASRSGGESAAEEGETDGIEGGDGSAAGSLKYRADVGIELGAPLGAEAVGHLPIGHARAQALLGAVVGGRHGPVGEEHEQVLPAGLDRALQLLAERMGRHTPQQVVKPGLELAGVAAQRRVGQIRTACPHATSALEKLLQAGSEGG